MVSEIGKVPRLTNLHSVRGNYLKEVVCDTDSLKNRPIGFSVTSSQEAASPITKTLKISSVVPWKTFEILVERNVSRLDISCLRKNTVPFMDIVISVLQANGIKVFHNNGCAGIAGRVDEMVYRKGNFSSGNVLLVGHTYTSQGLSMNNLTQLLESINLEFSGKQTHDEAKQVIREMVAIENLLHVLVINGLSWGFVKNDKEIRLVKLVPCLSGLEVALTKAFTLDKCVMPLVAVCIESFNGRSRLKQSPEIACTPICIKTPSIMPLSSYEKEYFGSVKWWEARRSSLCTNVIKLDNEPGSQICVSGRLWKYGTIKEMRTASRSDLSCLCGEFSNSKNATFIISSFNDHQLLHTASIIGYLNGGKLTCVPKLISFATVRDYQFLALDSCIKPICADDIIKYDLCSTIHRTLSELHQSGIMLCAINLESIAINVNKDKNKMGIIQFVGFSHAKLVRNVPQIMRDREHEQLDKLLLSI